MYILYSYSNRMPWSTQRLELSDKHIAPILDSGMGQFTFTNIYFSCETTMSDRNARQNNEERFYRIHFRK